MNSQIADSTTLSAGMSSEALARDLLKDMVSSFYQLQAGRIQEGNRLTAHFYRKLGVDRTEKLINQMQGDTKIKIELIDVLKADWKRITDAFADPEINKSLKTKRNYVSNDDKSSEPQETTRRSKVKTFSLLDPDIRGTFDDFLEWQMMSRYRDMLKNEDEAKKDLNDCLENFQVWREFLSKIKGVGPTIGAVMLATIDIYKAKTPASLWSYAGLDVVILDNEGNPDGRGRARYKGHLVEVEYVAKDGTIKLKNGITFNPFLKTKLVGVLADIMIKHRTPKYRDEYDHYKARITERELSLTQQALAIGNTDFKARTTAHLHRMAMRYMIKRFLVDYYVAHRTMEGLEVVQEYSIAKLGMVHHHPEGRWAKHMAKLTEQTSDSDPDATPEPF